MTKKKNFSSDLLHFGGGFARVPFSVRLCSTYQQDAAGRHQGESIDLVVHDGAGEGVAACRRKMGVGE